MGHTHAEREHLTNNPACMHDLQGGRPSPRSIALPAGRSRRQNQCYTAVQHVRGINPPDSMHALLQSCRDQGLSNKLAMRWHYLYLVVEYVHEI
jgi:hypothetical protein